jgi:hypothetical protein
MAAAASLLSPSSVIDAALRAHHKRKHFENLYVTGQCYFEVKAVSNELTHGMGAGYLAHPRPARTGTPLLPLHVRHKTVPLLLRVLVRNETVTLPLRVLVWYLLTVPPLLPLLVRHQTVPLLLRVLARHELTP